MWLILYKFILNNAVILHLLKITLENCRLSTILSLNKQEHIRFYDNFEIIKKKNLCFNIGGKNYI